MRRLPLRRWVSLATSPPSARRPGTAAACGDDSESAGGGSGPATPAARLLPEHHPRAGRSSAWRRASSPRSSAPTSSWRPKTFNAGPAAIEALFAGAHRRHLHRPEPGDQRLRQVQRRGRADHLRRGLRRRRAGGQARHHHARPTSRARRSPPRSWATPRTWRCATGSRRRASTDDQEGGGDV